MRWLRKSWTLWKRFSQLVGDVVARVLLSVLYFTAFAPFGLIARYITDPLRVRQRQQVPFWVERAASDQGLDAARRGY